MFLCKSKPSLSPSLPFLSAVCSLQLFITTGGLESLGGLLGANDTSSRYFNKQFPFHLLSCFSGWVVKV